MARSRKRRGNKQTKERASSTQTVIVSPAPEASAQEQFLSIIAQDGYSNAAAFLGDDSPLLSAGTFVRSSLTRNIELLTSMYRVNWICKRIIDMPTEDMTRAWYSLSGGIPELIYGMMMVTVLLIAASSALAEDMLMDEPFTWESLATLAGATMATVLIVELLKLPLDKVWKISTRVLVYFIALGFCRWGLCSPAGWTGTWGC